MKYSTLLFLMFIPWEIPHSSAIDQANTNRPRWVHLTPGHAPRYDPIGRSTIFKGYVFANSPPHVDVEILGSKILAVAPSGICGYYVYKNPRFTPADKMFSVRQEFAGSGRGIVSVTPYGAKELSARKKGDRLFLEIVASACQGLKISAIVDITVVTDVAVLAKDAKKNRDPAEPRGLENVGSSSSPHSSSSNSQLSNEFEAEPKIQSRTKTAKAMIHHHQNQPNRESEKTNTKLFKSHLHRRGVFVEGGRKFDGPVDSPRHHNPSKDGHRHHQNHPHNQKAHFPRSEPKDWLAWLPKGPQTEINEAADISEAAAMTEASSVNRTLGLVIGGNVFLVLSLSAFVAVFVFWRRRRRVKAEMNASTNQLHWEDTASLGGVVNRPPHRAVDANSLRVTLNPFDEDAAFEGVIATYDDPMRELDLEADESQTERDNIEKALHLTFQEELEENHHAWWEAKKGCDPESFQNFEWDDAM